MLAEAALQGQDSGIGLIKLLFSSIQCALFVEKVRCGSLLVSPRRLPVSTWRRDFLAVT